MSLCLESSLKTLRSVLMSNLQPTSTTLALGQNSCVSPCHCVSTHKYSTDECTGRNKRNMGRCEDKTLFGHLDVTFSFQNHERSSVIIAFTLLGFSQDFGVWLQGFVPIQPEESRWCQPVMLRDKACNWCSILSKTAGRV